MLSVAAPHRKNHHATTPAETMFCLAVTDLTARIAILPLRRYRMRWRFSISSGTTAGSAKKWHRAGAILRSLTPTHGIVGHFEVKPRAGVRILRDEFLIQLDAQAGL